MISAYALYRRSTTRQDLSIEEQRSEIRSWAGEHGYEIVREFSDDGSGLDTGKRTGFLALLATCLDPKRRAADKVLVYDVSRFSRLEPDEAAFHEHSLRRAGVRVLYTHEAGVNESGVTGHLSKALKRVMAHDYSLKLSQVVQRGMRAHAERGEWTGGRPPYGLRRALRQPDASVRLLEPGRWKARGEQVELVVDRVEAAVLVEQIFTPRARGKGFGAIAAALNARAVPPPASNRRRGVKVWTKGTIWAILRNPIYIGTLVSMKFRYSEIGKKRGKVCRPESERVIKENAVQAIIPRDLWDAAQRQEGSKRFGVGRHWHRYLLTAVIDCSACGKRYQGKRAPRHRRHAAYYMCGGRLASGPTVCDAPGVPTVYLDDAVIDGIQKRLDLVLDQDELRRRVRDLLALEAVAEDAVPALQTRLQETRTKIGRLVEALAGGSEPIPSARAALVGLEREQERLERDLAGAQARGTMGGRLDQVAGELVTALAKFREVLAAGEPDERKAVVRAFLQGIRIDKVGRQAVLRWYRLPRVDDAPLMLVEAVGIEPTSGNP